MTDDELLAEIERTRSAMPGEERNRRIQTLERLVAAPPTDESRAVEVLCEFVNKVGAVAPEITLITKILEKAAHSGGSGLDGLTRLVEERNSGAIQCGSRVLTSLIGTAQVRMGRSLAKELMRRDILDSLTESIVTALQQLRRPNARRAVAEELSKHLNSPDDLQIRCAVTILSEIGDKSVEPALVKVLDKLLDGYYGGHADTIRTALCSYFVKFKGRAAISGLLRGVEKGWNHGLYRTIGAIGDSHPEVQKDVLRLSERTEDINVRFGCMASLAAMRKTKSPVKAVVKIIESSDLTCFIHEGAHTTSRTTANGPEACVPRLGR